MLKHTHTQMQEVSLQKIGSKMKEIPNIPAEGTLQLEIEDKEKLQPFFLSPFKAGLDLMKFTHHIELSYNPLYNIINGFFQQEIDFLELSHQVLQHLYEKSNHPHIKTGELFVIHFTDVIFEDIHTDAIGIFKVENKIDFIQFKETVEEIHMRLSKGVKLQKIDKACLIINSLASDGLRLYSVDNNNYDAAYWQKGFLDIDYVENEALQTKDFVYLLNNFAQTELHEEGPFEQKKFLSEGIQLLHENEFVNDSIIKDELLDDFEIPMEDFSSFKERMEETNNRPIATAFSVAPQVVKKEERKLKREIHLDESVQIKLNLNDADALEDYIEKGFDEEKQMYYYKLYYMEER